MKLVKNNGNEGAFGLIGKGVEVKGDILFTDVLRVEGRVVGSLVAENGTLIVEESARIEARVEVGVCVISGTLEGNVKAKSRVEIYKSSRVRGDITTPVLLVEEGAVLNGSIGMNEQAANRLLETPRPETNEQGAMVKGA
jgi:cytoskeletal protein CcmA (bactofilin family)